ncbi:MAG: type IV pilus assembly protein PilM [bacterium]
MAFGRKGYVGLDIGSHMVKAVQLRRSGKNIELEKFGIGLINPGGEDRKDPAALRFSKVQAIKEALNSAGITVKHSISAVSGESIIVRYIQLPEMPEDELKNAIRWEAEEYIPFNIEDVNIDSSILGKAGNGGGEGPAKIDVLLVAAKKEMVNSHLDLLREVGLTPVIVDVDSFAFLNCFDINYQPDPSEVVGLINIGAELTNINVYNKGVSRFSRDISIAGNTITTAIQTKVGVAPEQAEGLKISEGAPFADKHEADTKVEQGSALIDTIRGTVERITGDDLSDDSPDAMAGRVIKNTLNTLISELKRSIQFFENQSNGLTVNRLVIGGGSSRMRNLVSYFSTELGLPVEAIDPLRRIGVTGRGTDMRLLEDYKQHLSVGIGLALRKVVD